MHDLFLFTYYSINAIEVTVFIRHVTTKFPKISMQYVKLSSKLPTKALEQQFKVKS